MTQTIKVQHTGASRPSLTGRADTKSHSTSLHDRLAHANDNLLPGSPTSTSFRAEARARGKFYTRPNVAATCWQLLRPHLPDDCLLIEPSAGAGVFIGIVEAERDIRGFDIAPDPGGHPAIIQHDFLARDIRDLLSVEDRRRPIVFIGNPPFGQRGKLAVAFLNRALVLGGVAAFIVPNGFRKWGVQASINPRAQLITDQDLPEEAFTFLGQPYSIRCCFQVWSVINRALPDIRIKSKPATSHADYRHGQYNCMRGSEKVFEHEWDFAVRRQGFGSYEIIPYTCDLNRHVQWALFHAGSREALHRLLSIDFSALARNNGKTPGFGKADVVAAYEGLLKQEAAPRLMPPAKLQAANSNSVCEAVAA